MGPTGAGKTILLECIIGFYRPEKGRICLEGKDITDERPEKRRIGIVYQDYALLPHLNVYKNIDYGLKKAEKDKAARKRKIQDISTALDIDHLLHRSPTTLSGGEQQRVALARALAVEPRLLLMDEPLSALDPQTSRNTRTLLRKTIRKLGMTVLHITHNMDDVWALANKMAIINDGRLMQHDSLDGIFNRPCSRFIADFVGASIFDGRVTANGNGLSKVDVNGVTLTSTDPASEGADVRIALRPENIMVFKERPGNISARNVLEAALDDYYQEGKLYHLFFKAGGLCIPAVVTSNTFQEMNLGKNRSMFLAIKSANVKII
jgi:molybdate transport system ATP-binding protein